MAVELRCPECRAKLRLKVAPEPGTEVECPKCAHVFAAPDLEADEEAPKKKKATRDDDSDEGDDTEKGKKADKDDEKGQDGDKKEKKEKGKGKKGAAGDPNTPQKKKAKKRKSSRVSLIVGISLCVLLISTTASVLIYFNARTPRSVEMMYYLPEDATYASGINLGHAQNYPELYKTMSGSFKDTEFKTAGDAIAKAAGAADMEAIIDYVVFGESLKNGSAIVFHTKEEFSGSSLGKLPGASEQRASGVTYYEVNAFKGSGRVRVFAPTPRIIVIAGSDVNNDAFQKMLTGNASNRGATMGERMGPLGKRVSRGTFWALALYDKDRKAPAPPPPENQGGSPGAGGGAASTGDDSESKFKRTYAEMLGPAQGFGVKASIGSREVRFEFVVWYKDSEKATSTYDKWKENALSKGDEDPPKWWTEQTNSAGGKKGGSQLRSNIGIGTDGALFYFKSTADTNDLKESVGSFATKITGFQNPQGGTGGPGTPPGGGPGGGPGRPRRVVRGRR